MLRWLTAARQLRDHGILGMNHRNARCILEHNPRALFPLVDEKSRLHDLCQRIDVPTPAILGQVQVHGQIRSAMNRIEQLSAFVLKPNRGSSGRGIFVITGRDPFSGGFVRSGGRAIDAAGIRQHLADTLAGLYSLGGRPDSVLIQQRILPHSGLASLCYQGIPDIRILVYRGEVAMAMLRLPTRQSGGRANLHQGGIGVGIDLATGVTQHATQGNHSILEHPDLRVSLIGQRIPHWPTMVEMSRRVARAVGMGYLGVDLVLDEVQGPMLLEANARPGLAIQLANRAGLLPTLTAIDQRLDSQARVNSLESAVAVVG